MQHIDKEQMMGIKKLLLILGLCLVFGLGIGVFITRSVDARPSINILMIGNSFTYYNDMPDMLETMLNNDGQEHDYPYHVDGILVGGAKLTEHLASGKPERSLKNKQYHFVTLQEHSSIMFYLNERSESERSFRQLSQLARHYKARPIIYKTWPHDAQSFFYDRLYSDIDNPKTPENMAIGLDNYFKTVARKSQARTAPILDAWMIVYKNNPDINLYSPDYYHPSLAGSYLAALVFYQTITGHAAPVDIWSPDNLPEKDKAVLIAAANQVL